MTRQDLACVYEAPTTARQVSYAFGARPNGRPVIPWRDVLGSAIPPSVCPFYLGRLADASDVHAATPHFRRGTLAAWLGRAPDAPLLECLEALDAGEHEIAGDPDRARGWA